MASPADRAGTALVTGAASGLGAAVVRRLLDRDWRIVAAINQTPVDQGVEADVETIAVDLSTELGTESTVRSLPAFPHALVHCAVRFRRRPLSRTDSSDTMRDLRVNLVAADRLIRGVVDRFGRPPERIVLIGSSGAGSGGTGLTSYSASKLALTAYGRGLAAELGRLGSTVNVVEPGPMLTPLASRQAGAWTRDARRAPIDLQVPGPAAVVELVQYLLDDRSRNVTGARLVADGGLTAASAP